MGYGQFCPIAKSMELLGERWTVLILREVLMDSRRFNRLQRGLGTISPALLSKRLGDLEENGLIVKRKIQGQRGFEYFPTPSAEALLPVLMALGEWGMQWAKENLTDDDYDVDLLMLYLERSVVTDKLVGSNTIIQFEFTDLSQQKNWWLVIEGDRIDVCVKDPGKDVDVYFTTTVRTMTDVWLGHDTYTRAIRDADLVVVGPKNLTNNVSAWLRNSDFQISL